jgi:hypothetical protein
LQSGFPIAGDLNGMSLEPGTYEAAAAISLTGNLTLVNTEAIAIASPDWTFILDAALSLAASASMVFDETAFPGGPADVHWIIEGAVSLGAESILASDIKAVGAVVFGANAVVDGTFVESGGAVSMGAGSSCDRQHRCHWGCLCRGWYHRDSS